MLFLVRTSTIFGADVHDPKGCRKTLHKKHLRRFFGPYLHVSKAVFVFEDPTVYKTPYI